MLPRGSYVYTGSRYFGRDSGVPSTWVWQRPLLGFRYMVSYARAFMPLVRVFSPGVVELMRVLHAFAILQCTGIHPIERTVWLVEEDFLTQE
jgi:hypothetical protein